jgi:hypothetical protein
LAGSGFLRLADQAWREITDTGYLGVLRSRQMPPQAEKNSEPLARPKKAKSRAFRRRAISLNSLL